MSTGGELRFMSATYGIMRAAGFPFQAVRVVRDVELTIAVIHRSLIRWSQHKKKGPTLKESYRSTLGSRQRVSKHPCRMRPPLQQDPCSYATSTLWGPLAIGHCRLLRNLSGQICGLW